MRRPRRRGGPGSDARIAWLSPMPPAPTGVATYAEAVLADLRPMLDRPILVRWPVADVHEGDVAEHALAVYHLGNNVAFHRDIYRHAIATPGLVVLHDLALDDFVRGLVALGDPLGFRAAREATRVPPPSGDDPALDGPLAVPWAAHVARRSRGIVVHAPYARDYLRSVGVRTPIHVVPHPLPERPAALDAARARREELRAPLVADGMRTLVGVLGDLNEAKLVDRALAAVARLDPSVHVVLVGRRIPDVDAEALVGASGLGRLARVLHDVPDADFLAWLCASDVVVDLRHPHRGEVSGTLARAMQAGRPTVVSAVGTYLDVPDDAVVRVAPGPVEPEELAAAIARVADPAVGRAVGEAAARAVAADPAATVRAYAAAIGETLDLVADPARRALARWARALADLGATEADLAAGAGARYAAALEALVAAPGAQDPPLD